jgi:hypothetical protein
MTRRSSRRLSSAPGVDGLGITTYTTNVRALDASGLTPNDRTGAANSYVTIQLVGNLQTSASPVVENSLTPTWDAVLTPIRGFSVGTDIMRIRVIDKDRVPGNVDESTIGGVDLPLRTLDLGRTIDLSLLLLPVKKGKIVTKAEPGTAGSLHIAVHLAYGEQPAFTDAPWSWPLHSATVEFISASDIRVPDPANSDVFLSIRLSPALNDQNVKTKGVKNTVNPQWNEKHEFFFDALEDASLSVGLRDKASGSDERLASLNLPLRRFTVGAPPEEVELPLKPSGKNPKGGKVKLRVAVRCDNPGGVAQPKGLRLAGDAPPPLDGDDVFRWGSYSSSYGTNFTGYSDCSERLSDIRPEEQAFHKHATVPPPENPEPPKKPTLFGLTGKVVAAKDLPFGDGSEKEYSVVVSIANKVGKEKRKVQSEVVAGTADPAWNFGFNLGDVRKGLVVEFTVVQGSGEDAAPVAFGVKKVKEIEIDAAAPIEIPLGDLPFPRFEKRRWQFTSWGTIVVVLVQTLKPKDPAQ